MKRPGRCVARVLLLLMVLLVGPAGAQDERMAMARVRLTTEPGLLQGCAPLGSARDDSIRDLRRKIVKMGGNTAHISFGGTADLAMIYAEIFRCGDPPAAAPGTTPAHLPLPPAPPPAPTTR